MQPRHRALAQQCLAEALGEDYAAVEAVCWPQAGPSGTILVGALVVDRGGARPARDSVAHDVYAPLRTSFQVRDERAVSVTLHSAHLLPAMLTAPGAVAGLIPVSYWPRAADETLLRSDSLRTALGQAALEFRLEMQVAASLKAHLRGLPWDLRSRASIDAADRRQLERAVWRVEELHRLRGGAGHPAQWLQPLGEVPPWALALPIRVADAKRWLDDVLFHLDLMTATPHWESSLRSRPEDAVQTQALAATLHAELPRHGLHAGALQNLALGDAVGHTQWDEDLGQLNVLRAELPQWLREPDALEENPVTAENANEDEEYFL